MPIAIATTSTAPDVMSESVSFVQKESTVPYSISITAPVITDSARSNGTIMHWPVENNTILEQVHNYIEPQKENMTSAETVQTTNNNDLENNILTLMEQQSNMLTFLTVINDNQKILSVNQHNITLRQAELSAQFEQFVKQYLSCHSKEKTEIEFKAIANKDALENFENMLKTEIDKTELKSKFSLVVGKHNGNGINSAYKLVDLILSLNFENCVNSGRRIPLLAYEK